MSKQQTVRLAIRKIRENPDYKHLSYKDILNIVYFSQYGFVSDMISSANRDDEESFNSVRISHIGSFIAHPKKVDLSVKRYKAKLEEDKNEESSE